MSSQFHVAMVPHISCFLLFFLCFNGVSGTSITVVNDCGFTVWPGISSSHVLNITGFELKTGTSRSLQVPKNWLGRIWGRTGCGFNGSRWSCATGDCGTGEMKCNGKNYTPPVTIADFSINDPANYYISTLDGFNLPMIIEPTRADFTLCKKMGCTSNDLNERCPSKLKLQGGGGCNTACQVFGTEDYCCQTMSTKSCNPTSFGQFFKTECQNSVTYEYDNGNSIATCYGADYIVRFCPPTDTFSTLKLGSQVNATGELASNSRNFKLLFFGSGFGYLGISYEINFLFVYVWVANPNDPIKSTSNDHGLSIDPKTGNLIITAGGKTVMNITDVQVGLNPNVTATLEDNGNFRLINKNDEMVLWQSFDHPYNTLLPGMKLGYDMTTGQNWTLTSWMGIDIPTAGAFTLSWEADNESSQRLVIRQRGQPYWTSGNLQEQGFQYMSEWTGLKITSVYNNTKRYFSYEKDHESFSDGTSLNMLALTPEGRIEDVVTAVSLTPEFCYGFNTVLGCINGSSLPPCRTKDDSFSKKNGEFVSDLTVSVTDSNSSLGISDCFLKCWHNCGCVGFNSSSINGTGCIFWSGSNRFSVDELASSSLIYVISSQNQLNLSSGNKTKINTVWKWILIGTAILLGFLASGILQFLKMKNRREKEERRKRDEYFLSLTASESFRDVHELESSGGKGNDLLIFSFASILAATNDFSVQNKLGQGGFGPVYKGKLTDGREIAVKRLSRTSGQGLVEFKNELILIAKLQHTYLVRVLGCCIHREEKMLIYEYMPNKSLDFFIFDEKRKVELDWPKRFNIIEGIAQGLLYLHKYSRMRVIHRDLKAGNILLDESMNPKISDFGLARIFKQNENETEERTNRVVGTYGYMAPEYAMGGAFSVKSDIFSFGVLILEILSGRKNSSFTYLDDTFGLIEFAWELWQKGDVLEFMDPTLRSTCVVQQFSRTVHVALLCVQERATDRPATSDMISMLLNDTLTLPSPNRPPSVNGRINSSSPSDQSKPKDLSVNNMTITLLDGR